MHPNAPLFDFGSVLGGPEVVTQNVQIWTRVVPLPPEEMAAQERREEVRVEAMRSNLLALRKRLRGN